MMANAEAAGRNRWQYWIKPAAAILVTLFLIPVLVNTITAWFEKEEPELQHVITETTSIEVGGQSTSICSASEYNVGNKMAEDVNCVMTIPNCKIEKLSVNKPESMKTPQETINGDTATIHFDKLNSKDAISIHVLVTGPKPIPKKATFSGRGNNVTSKEMVAAQQSSQSSSWFNEYANLLNIGFSMFCGVYFVTMAYQMASLAEKLIKLKINTFLINVKFDGENKVLVKTLRGVGSSANYVVVLGPLGKHMPTDMSYDELRKLGEGEHTTIRPFF